MPPLNIERLNLRLNLPIGVPGGVRDMFLHGSDNDITANPEIMVTCDTAISTIPTAIEAELDTYIHYSRRS